MICLKFFSVSLLILIGLINFSHGSNSTSIDECNTVYGCFLFPANCNGLHCDFLVKWRENNENIEFTIVTKLGNPKKIWTAIGFSNDQMMGSDSVSLCRFKDDIPQKNTVESYFTTGRSNPTLISEDSPSVGLSDIKVQSEDNLLICSFKRAKINSISERYYDLNQKYYLLVAKGELDDDDLSFHSQRTFSSEMIDFRKLEKAKSSNDTIVLAKIHALLMIIAWIFFATIGIIFARYYKYILPKAIVCNVQFWFTIHRSFMVSVCLISIVAFLLILAYKEWKWVDITVKSNFAHSICGIVTIGLALIQPIMAYFRPDKTAPNRPLFNWAHRSVGLLAYLSSIVAIYIAIIVFIENYHGGVLVAWITWLVILIILLEVIDSKIRFNDKVQNSNPMPLSIEKEKSKVKTSFKTLLIVFHIFATLTFTTYLILVILKIF